MPKSFLIFTVFLILSGCQYFDNQVPEKDALLEKELQSITWEVDEFPSVPQCDSIADQTLHKQCFIDFLTQNIQQRISVDTLALRFPELDTINVKITVFADSSITFEPEIGTDTYEPEVIDSIIRTRLRDFPSVSPALKRGLPVKTQFILPVILHIE